MQGYTRRLATLSAGVFVLAVDAFNAPSSNAGGTVSKAQCLAAGGTYKADGYCSTPQADNECKKQIGEEKNSITYFDPATGRCKTAKVPCYVTSACVDRIGLDDDCFELSALRRFRDKDLAYMDGGKEVIEAYYRDAPEIVQGILASGNASRELPRIYARYILPSALAAYIGLPKLARRIYTSMMRDLASRYAIGMAW